MVELGSIYEKHKGLSLVYEVEMRLIDEVLTSRERIYIFWGEFEEVLYTKMANNFYYRIVAIKSII